MSYYDPTVTRLLAVKWCSVQKIEESISTVTSAVTSAPL